MRKFERRGGAIFYRIYNIFTSKEISVVFWEIDDDTRLDLSTEYGADLNLFIYTKQYRSHWNVGLIKYCPGANKIIDHLKKTMAHKDVVQINNNLSYTQCERKLINSTFGFTQS